MVTSTDWKRMSLGDCARVQTGFAFESNDFRDSGIPLVRISNVQKRRIDLTDCVYLDAFCLAKYPQFVLKKGDILLGMSGTIGRAGVYQNNESALLNQRVGRIIVEDESLMQPQYLGHLVASSEFERGLLKNADGSAQANISPKQIESIEILIPPLPEQHKIAEILSTVDETIENTDAIIQETQQQKKGLMQKLFTEGIGHTKFKETRIGQMPEEWKIIRLVEHVSLPTGQVDPKDPAYANLPLVAPDHIESGAGRLLARVSAASQNAVSGKYLFESGDVLYGKIRPHLRKAVLVDFSGLCSADMYPLRPGNDLNPRYLLAIILSDDFSMFAESRSMRTGIPKLNRKELGEYYCALPPLIEQERIASILLETDAKTANEQATKAELEQLKKGLMQVLLTGKVRVKV